MKVIMVNDFAYVNGGASQIALQTALSLAKKNVDTILFTGMGPVAANLKSQEKLSIVCLHQYDILSDPNRFRAIWQGLWNQEAARCFADILRGYETSDTIVHVHTCQKVLSSSCIHVAKTLGFKVIYHLHDYGAVCPNLGFYDYQRKEICHRVPMSRECLFSNCDVRKYTHKLWRMARQLMQKTRGGLPGDVDAFLAVSDFSLDILRPFLPSGIVVKVLPNPLDASQRYMIDVGHNKYFLFFGRMSVEKNPMEFAECARDLQLPALFIGDGDYLEVVKNIYPDAVYTGWLGKECLYDYMKNVRCLVFPSAWYETQGLSVQEMASIGIPSIVSDACAAKEMIVHGVNGWVYESQNKEDLKTFLSQMMDDEVVRTMGRDAYTMVQRNAISEDLYINELMHFYGEVLSDSESKKTG